MDGLKRLADAATENDVLSALVLMHLMTFDGIMSKQNMIKAAKQKKDKNPNLWTLRVRKKFGECLKSFSVAQSIVRTRQQLKNNTSSDCTLYADGYIGDENSVRMYRIYPLLHSVVSVRAGTTHVLAIMNDGRLMSMGTNAFGQLGHSLFTSEVQKFRTVEICSPVKSVGVGYTHSFCITVDDKAFGWGSFENGRLGVPISEDDEEIGFVTKPTELVISEPLQMVVGGSVHSVGLTYTGKIYSFGMSLYNGLEENEDVYTPRLMHFDSTSLLDTHLFYKVSIGKGGYHTLALTLDGIVFAWGHNRCGQITHLSENVDGIVIKRPIRIMENVADIECGWGHSAIVDHTGKLFMAGRNVCGQVGVDPNTCKFNTRGHEYVDEYTQIKLPNHFCLKRVICGFENTYIIGSFGNKILDWRHVFEFGSGIGIEGGHELRICSKYPFLNASGDCLNIQHVECTWGVIF